ncbi:MAG: Nif3-like dinuclear metal center hexameric protein [Opitutales bacterium]
MASLQDIVKFCDARTRQAEIADFPGAENGLQVENDGTVRKVGAAVDAGIAPFLQAAERGIDFIIVHHGLFWTPPVPMTGRHYAKYRAAFAANLAVYGSHLPLDAHPEIGNNALLARELGLTVSDWFLPYEGTPIAALAEGIADRAALRAQLEATFPAGITAMEFGDEALGPVAILTGSGRSALAHLKGVGTRTLITGELRQEHFNLAQEEGFNLYCCGHYATEVFGVQALAREVAEQFGLEWEFVPTACPL